MTTGTSADDTILEDESSMYELFMGLLTIASLIVLFFIVVVRIPQVDAILVSTDTLFCIIFLADFARSLVRAPDRSAYLFGPWPGRSLPMGVFDLIGSIPSIAIFRAFRLFRLARTARILRARGGRSLAREFVRRRAEAAIYIIIVASLAVLVIGSCAIAFIEPPAAGSNIKTGADAFWWAFVTITTVGYGDRFPVTEWGRFVGMLTMAVGIGIFGVLTSYLSSIFLSPRAEDAPSPAAAAPAESTAEPGAVAAELAALRAELADLRRILEPRTRDSAS